jgi:hypothetical protein
MMRWLHDIQFRIRAISPGAEFEDVSVPLTGLVVYGMVVFALGIRQFSKVTNRRQRLFRLWRRRPSSPLKIETPRGSRSWSSIWAPRPPTNTSTSVFTSSLRVTKSVTVESRRS